MGPADTHLGSPVARVAYLLVGPVPRAGRGDPAFGALRLAVALDAELARGALHRVVPLAVDHLTVGVLLVGLGRDARQDHDRAGALAPLPLQLPFLLVAGGFLLGEAAGLGPVAALLEVELGLLQPVGAVDPHGGGQVGARAVLGDLVLFVEAAAVEDEVGGGGSGSTSESESESEPPSESTAFSSSSASEAPS